MGQRSIASAFAAWSDHTLQMQRAKQAMQQVAARLTNRQLSAAFYAWHEATLQKQHAAQSAHKVLLRFQQGCKVKRPACAAVLARMRVKALFACVCKPKPPVGGVFQDVEVRKFC